jgi:hypothetical protein
VLTIVYSPNDTLRDRFLAYVDAALKASIADQGCGWEYSVVETSRDLWKTQGLVPPMPGSKAEQEWTRINRAMEFEAEDGRLSREMVRIRSFADLSVLEMVSIVLSNDHVFAPSDQKQNSVSSSPIQRHTKIYMSSLPKGQVGNHPTQANATCKSSS